MNQLGLSSHRRKLRGRGVRNRERERERRREGYTRSPSQRETELGF
jgi:hypothetical protein